MSFGTILTPLGIGMLVYGFGGFFQLLPGGDISSLLLIYGFVISLLGFALSYAQLKPVPCKTTAEAFALRDSQCTDIQKQVCQPQVSLVLTSRLLLSARLYLGLACRSEFRLQTCRVAASCPCCTPGTMTVCVC